MTKFQHNNETKIWISSDPHYSHKNICAGVTSWIKPEDWPTPYHEWHDNEARKNFCKNNGLRDFPTVEKMNSTIVNRFNEYVGQNDILFILGDIGFGGKESVGIFMKQLICKNVYLIYGNHDQHIGKNADGVQGHFKSCDYYNEIYVNGQHIILCHYAMRVWHKSHRGSWMLYGHSHGSIEDAIWGKSMDVGVDTNDMYPYSFDDIERIMKSRDIKAIDHHIREGS